MKHIFSLAVILAGKASAALALPAVPARPHLEAIQIIYGSDPALRCFNAARDGVELRNGLDFCNTAVIDPLMNYRAETLVNRGIILYNLGNRNDALADFNTAITYNPSLGDAYLNRAMVLISLNRNQQLATGLLQPRRDRGRCRPLCRGLSRLHAGPGHQAGLCGGRAPAAALPDPSAQH